MDLVCPTCGEYWDFDSLHEEAQERYGIPYYVYENEYSTLGPRTKNPEYNSDHYHVFYEQVSKEFRREGCKALKSFGNMNCKPQPVDEDSDRLSMADAAKVMYELLGDDMDGAAAMLEDYEMGY